LCFSHLYKYRYTMLSIFFLCFLISICQ